MTCIEKLRESYPEWDEDQIRYFTHTEYPSALWIARDPSSCTAGTITCETCWSCREVTQEDEARLYDVDVELIGDDMRRLDRLTKRLDKTSSEVVAGALQLFEDALNAIDEGSQKWMSLEIVGEGADSLN